jgi:hypothetical protein
LEKYPLTRFGLSTLFFFAIDGLLDFEQASLQFGHFL